LKAAGWQVFYSHGRDVGGQIVVYGHDEPGRGLFVDIQEIAHTAAYSCLVTDRAWPQFFRTELVPIMQARDISDIAASLERLGNLVTAIAKYGLETPVGETDGLSQLGPAADDPLWSKRIATNRTGGK
jgi:hypothetical protein